jgi:two-component system sensor kinase FixL
MIREALGKAAEQALRAGDIIRRLRDFVTRRESDKTIVRIARLLEEASALALVGARELGVMVRFQIAPTVTNVLVDAVQIQQVLVNLLRNALEAMQESVRRELFVVATLTADFMVEIMVSDTGHGVPEEFLPKLFEPFMTTKETGMGVGLSISKTIIEAHGGRLWVEANPIGGTIFRFTLPSVNVE